MTAVGSSDAMNGSSVHRRHNSTPTCTTTLLDNNINRHYQSSNGDVDRMMVKQAGSISTGLLGNAHFMKWRSGDLFVVLRYHPLLCVLAFCLFFFMGVEYTLRMIPPSSPPFDLGFVVTLPLHRLLASSPALNTLLAALNTVRVFHLLWPGLIIFFVN